MRSKLVSRGVAIHKERLQRKETKRQDSGRVKPRGVTLKEAYELRKLKEKMAFENDDSEEDEQEQDDMAGEQGDEEEGECEERDEYEDEGEDFDGEEEEDEQAREEPEEEEEEEIVVIDPVKQKADEEAAKQRLKQQEIESRNMRNRFEEKKTQPKYQEMLSRRSTLPAYQMKHDILDAIAKHSVVVISGDTGEFAVQVVFVSFYLQS